jgi:hypothetical protein
MFTILSIYIFFVVLWVLWHIKGRKFSTLAFDYLMVAPFLAVPSLINHNLDHDLNHPYIRMIPLLLLVLMLAPWFRLSLPKNQGKAFKLALLCLAGYSLISLLQTIVSDDPLWSFITWAWTVPGFILFFAAGYSISYEKIEKSRYPLWVIVGFVLIGLFLRFYGMRIGRTEDFWLTRNYGSVFASGIILISLYGGMAWINARHSRSRILVFYFFSFLTLFASMSRSAFLILVMILSLFRTLSLSEIRQHIKKIAIVLVPMILFGIVITRSTGSFNLAGFIQGWQTRIPKASVIVWAQEALQVRQDEFADIRGSIWNDHFFLGAGFGRFYQQSRTGYQDAHNLFFTEAYENGLIAAVFLYGFFVICLFSAGRTLFDKKYFPIAISIFFFFIIVHTGGYVLSERSSPTAYFSAYCGWCFCFLAGTLFQNRKASLSAKAED